MVTYLRKEEGRKGRAKFCQVHFPKKSIFLERPQPLIGILRTRVADFHLFKFLNTLYTEPKPRKFREGRMYECMHHITAIDPT